MNPYERFVQGKDPMEVLAATAGRLAGLMDGLTPQQLAHSPAPGKWSIRDIVAHLADTEMVQCCRCRWIAYEDNPTLIPFDQDKWASGGASKQESTAEMLERFRLLRASQLRLFRSVSGGDWERTGQHLQFGKQRLGDYPPLCAGHDLNHMEQIARIREALCGS
jgi:DinB superfamily